MTKKLRFTLTLETEVDGDDTDGVHRLRALLKRLARGYRFNCIDVRPSESAADRQQTEDYAYRFAHDALQPVASDSNT